MTLANWSLSRPSAWLDSVELPSAEQLMRLYIKHDLEHPIWLL